LWIFTFILINLFSFVFFYMAFFFYLQNFNRLNNPAILSRSDGFAGGGTAGLGTYSICCGGGVGVTGVTFWTTGVTVCCTFIICCGAGFVVYIIAGDGVGVGTTGVGAGVGADGGCLA
jgi:small-conductance mechanosensitive channel